MIAWGRKVSPEFRIRVLQIAGDLSIAPDWIMGCIAFESAQTFRADVENAKGSGAVGLIQFMPATAQALGTSTAALAAMTPVEQLDVVERYFAQYRGRLHSLGDLYMAILWPAAIGKPDDYVLFDSADLQHHQRYAQNAGLDQNKDGKVTRGEACARVEATMRLGMTADHYG